MSSIDPSSTRSPKPKLRKQQAYNPATKSYHPSSNPYVSLQASLKYDARKDSTTDDEYDGDEFDDDSSILLTPPMSSPLLKLRDGEERRSGKVKSKDEATTVCWNVDGEESKLGGEVIDGFTNSSSTQPPKENKEISSKTDNKNSLEMPIFQAHLESNNVTSSPLSASAVGISQASEAVSSGSAAATLASPGLQRSDSVKYCRSSNGNAQRSGHGSIVSSGMAGSNSVTGVNRPARRVPSLKLKRLHVLGSRAMGGGGGGSGGDKLILDDTGDIKGGANNTGNLSAPSAVLSGNVNPSITITLDSDSDSIYSDYLSPEINYKTHDSKVQFLGDETSLYGTPKEEAPSTGDTMAAEVLPKVSSTKSYLREQIMNFFQPSDNKLAMKLFGNKNALIKEKMRHKRVGNWVIHPCSNFRKQLNKYLLNVPLEKSEEATAATKSEEATAATKSEKATSATKYEEATSATKSEKATSATKYEEATSATKSEEATSATKYEEATSATKYEEATSATKSEEATSATKSEEATSATKSEEATSTTKSTHY